MDGEEREWKNKHAPFFSKYDSYTLKFLKPDGK